MSTFIANTNLKILDLSGNPLVTDAPEPKSDNGDDDTSFNQTNSTTDTTAYPINSINNSRSWSDNDVTYDRITFLDTLPWLVIVIISGALITVSLINRKRLSLWIYTKYGVRLSDNDKAPDDEDDKLFDAFISYSSADQGFVHRILAPELEYGSARTYRLCLHYRDLPFASTPTSGCYLGDAIVEAMEASKRSIMVISDAYLKSEWCKFDFKSAHLEVARRLAAEKDKKKLILIVLGNVYGAMDLDPDIRALMKSCTTIQWGEKLFWENLRHALPKLNSSSSSNGSSSSYGNNSNNSSTSEGGSFIPKGSFTTRKKKLHPFSSNPNYSSVSTIDGTLQAHMTPINMFVPSQNFSTFNPHHNNHFHQQQQSPNFNPIQNYNKTLSYLCRPHSNHQPPPTTTTLIDHYNSTHVYNDILDL